MASVANHSSMTGPNSAPTLAVPRFCTKKRRNSTSSATGMTKGLSTGVATSRPSTAESTEIAGVTMPSPKNIAAPRMPTIMIQRSWRGLPLASASASAMSAMMPPSPRLSARMMKVTYFTATTTSSAHRISERMPITLSGEYGTGWVPAKASFRAYNGLVPMSP